MLLDTIHQSVLTIINISKILHILQATAYGVRYYSLHYLSIKIKENCHLQQLDQKGPIFCSTKRICLYSVYRCLQIEIFVLNSQVTPKHFCSSQTACNILQIHINSQYLHHYTNTPLHLIPPLPLPINIKNIHVYCSKGTVS